MTDFKDFNEPDNCSELNSLWKKLEKWYGSKKEGLSVRVTKTKEGFGAFFKFTKRW